VNPAPIPAEDAKPQQRQGARRLSDLGHLNRVVIIRFKNDADLLAGMEKMIKQEKIKNPVIVSAAGSLNSYQVCTR